MTDRKGPVLFELDDAPDQSPAAAPPVPDPDTSAPRGQAMQTVAVLAARRPSMLARIFWGALLALLGLVVSLAAWDFVTGLLAANPVLGWIATALVGLVLLALLLIALREAASFFSLGRLDTLHKSAGAAMATGDLKAAQGVTDDLLSLYRNRPDLRLGSADLAARRGDIFDADGLLHLAETTLLTPLDAAAKREVETAARQVATVTALVPLALADVVTALSANLRMIRRIAEVYGGRAGTLGAWRLTRAVITHLVATGMVAVGDDMLDSMIGGGIVGKLSRRFGEGVVNGALTARVGVAAMEVCRPMPFRKGTRPSVSALVRRALSGLFTKGGG
ncbi:MAG: TIGR01620 family protein [Rhodobacteraceae bacterium CG17_big_fil_post_rev_8_21_14_2_50_65_11]|nr:MAG: TIGR01620 family protein [Rhodobacteraceae bacterium CG17_big_fil_post_rev_8_21_14_2_50_65_11]